MFVSRIARFFKRITNGAVSFEARVKATVVVLIVFSAAVPNASQLIGALRMVMEPSVDVVAHHEKRLEALRKALPQRGVVGYLTDAPTRAERMERHLMTGYVLAPLVVVQSADWPLVVGDFRDAAARRTIAATFRVREDFGNGVMLLEKKRP